MERFCVNGDVVGIVVVDGDGEKVVVGGTVVVIGTDDVVTGEDVVLGCTVVLLTAV